MNRTVASRGRARAAALSVVCLLVAFTASAQPGPGSVAAAAYMGYRLDGDEVTFTFDRSQYESATRGDNGARVPMVDVSLGEFSVVAVAGEFNDWSTDAWSMELVEPGVYETSRPLDEFAEQDFWAFKFVIDRLLWVEPPASATNIVPTGLGNDSFNLARRARCPSGRRRHA